MGANGGIGGALAQIYEGDKILTARDVATIEHHDAQCYAVDVMDQASLDGFLSDLDGVERLSGFVYAIGSITLKPMKSVTQGALQDALSLNLGAAIQVLQKIHAPLKKGQGSVVLFSTIAVGQGFPSHAVISAAKGAVEGFAKALAAEWAPHIRVNVIAPSLSDTALASPLTASPPMAKGIADMHPIPRLGHARDSAEMANFLLDADKSGWMTGQILHIDGGRSTLRTRG